MIAKLKNVSVRSLNEEGREGRRILKNINMELYKGQWLTLLGLNGSGKSTLAKAIAGLRLPSASGEATRPYSHMPIPMVLQHPEASMLGASPWEDVVLMLEQNSEDAESIVRRAEAALQQVGLGEKLHQPISTMSGGQKQLTAIAGCLAVQAPLLVLDEVTSMLHPEAAEQVLEQVRELNNQGVTVVWVTQNLEELRTGDRVIVLDQGEIAFEGDVQQWFKRSQGEAGSSTCERQGFEAPYCVQVCWELEALGMPLSEIALTPEELAALAGRMLSAEGGRVS